MDDSGSPAVKTLATMTREGFVAPVTVHADTTVRFLADADINADGSPHAYRWDNRGTDHIDNAKDANGNFVGVLTDRNGTPLKQGPDDPAPGYYISTTRYEWPDATPGTQNRYVNGEEVIHATVPPIVIDGVPGVVMGCLVEMWNTENGKFCQGMVADSGPKTKVGEVSPAAARALGLNPSPRNGGTDDAIIQYVIHPGVPAFINGKPVQLQRKNGTHVSSLGQSA